MSFDGNVVLCRPAATSMSASAVTGSNLDVYLEYGTQSGVYGSQTTTESLVAGTPFVYKMDNLTANTQYYYRVQWRVGTSGSFTADAEYKFHTQRTTGSSFKFAIMADIHYNDPNLHDAALYNVVAANALADDPDLFIDLGDAFMINLIPTPTQPLVEAEFANQRPAVAEIAKTVPRIFAIGNREMERGWVLDGTADNDAIWAANARKKYYPNPNPNLDSFYTGDTVQQQHVGDMEDYYEFTWGDCQFIALFPWWYTQTNPAQSGDDWDWTIGDAQYNWLKGTLENSTAAFKFVLIHHVLGGVRGGQKWSTKFEWGGENDQGVNEFATKRPNWSVPIHQLFVDNGVKAVFQGHDHIYVKQDVDGFVYQAVQMPADGQYALRNSNEYDGGIKHANSGHLRVTVSDGAEVDVEYVRAFKPGDGTNGEVTHSYTITDSPPPPPPVLEITNITPSAQYPQQNITVTGTGFGNGTGSSIHFGNPGDKSYNYPHNKITSWSDTQIVCEVPVYACNRFRNNPSIQRDVWVELPGETSNSYTYTILKPTSC